MIGKLDINITGLKKLLNKLDEATKDEVFFKSLSLGGRHLTGWVKDNRLTGPRPRFLGVKTGLLRASITSSKPEHVGNEYTVKIGTNVKYAPIHEFGGTIYPVNKTVLRWKGPDGKFVFSQRSVIPARPFLRPALQDQNNQQDILKILTKNINTALEK